MKVVYAPGCWDLLHVGHVAFLEQAAKLGDKLVVGVASDEAILSDKGSLPVIPMSQRLEMVNSLRCVDLAILYHCLEFVTQLQAVVPSFLAVGEQWGQKFRHQNAEAWMREHGGIVVTIPYTQGVSSTAIKERIKRS